MNSAPMLLTCSFTIGARVERADDGAEAAGGADGAQAGDAGADHQHLGGRHLAGRGHLAGEEAAVEARRLDHRPVAGDVGHRGQRVHLLRAGDARHLVDGDRRDLARRQLLDQGAVLARPQERDQHRARLEPVDLVLARRLDLQQHVSRGPQGAGLADQRGSGLGVILVGERRLESGVGLRPGLRNPSPPAGSRFRASPPPDVPRANSLSEPQEP